jgi:hypothetical protein
MASQLTVNADYGTTENELKTLYTAGAEGLYGEDAITAISVKSVSLLTDNSGSDKFTKTIPVKFTGPATYGVTAAQWNKANNAWSKVTDFNISDITVNGEQVDKLTTKCLTGNESSKFLILPQSVISDGVDKGAVEVNTYYGKVLIAKKADYTASKYSDDEYDKAWYRIVSSAKNETTEENASTPGTGKHVGKFKVVAKSTALGMQQTINDFSDHKAGSGYVKGEPTGYALTRYVNVDLTKLDMSDLHVTNDKQLRDVVRVWKKMGLGTVTVYLDGDSNGEFEISQKTIKVINAVNADAAKEETPRSFSVKPCHVTTPDEDCNTIVITGANEIANVQDLTFIKYNDVNGNGSFDTGDVKADVALKAGETWNWAASTTAVKKVTVDATNCGINSFINRGTFVSNATATLAIYDNASTPAQVNTIPFINAAKANFNVNAGTLNVQFNVTNNGTVTIAQNAQYRQDGRKDGVNTLTTFTNQATNVPKRFGGNDAEIGLVNNSGVFATVAAGQIINYGLIEHLEDDAKTYITKNQTTSVSFSNAFSDTNKRGRINLKFSNKNEDNISVSAAASEGFISVTVTADDLKKAGITSDELDAGIVGVRVNYIIINSGIKTISRVSPQVQYVEINNADKSEIAWSVTDDTEYVGLMVLTDVNVKLNTKINVTRATYLGADMYVGGTFTTAAWNGYYGNTLDNVASQYITY